MAYRSTQEQWLKERAEVAARYEALKRKKERRAEVEKLPTLSQRVIGRFLLWLKR